MLIWFSKEKLQNIQDTDFAKLLAFWKTHTSNEDDVEENAAQKMLQGFRIWLDMTISWVDSEDHTTVVDTTSLYDYARNLEGSHAGEWCLKQEIGAFAAHYLMNTEHGLGLSQWAADGVCVWSTDFEPHRKRPEIFETVTCTADDCGAHYDRLKLKETSPHGYYPEVLDGTAYESFRQTGIDFTIVTEITTTAG